MTLVLGQRLVMIQPAAMLIKLVNRLRYKCCSRRARGNFRIIHTFILNNIFNLFSDKNLGVTCTMKTETVDGKLEKIRQVDYFEQGELEEEILISEEDRNNFKTTPPSAEDLSRLLKDFVLFYKPLVRLDSGTSTTVINVLVNSFREAGKFGKFLVEDVENLTLPFQKPIE